MERQRGDTLRVKPEATLVTFAVGHLYQRYADAMLESADKWFFGGRAQLLTLRTPYGGMRCVRDRHTYMLKARRRIRGRYVFFLDADMLFEGPVGEEVVADGVTAVLHPAIGKNYSDWTYERNPDSAAYIPDGEGPAYYVGAIIGAPRADFLDLSAEVDRMCKQDGDYIPVWQDESYINRILIDNPPALELDERYCAWFNRAVPDARIRALNKTPEEFQWRNEWKEAAAA